MPSLDVIAKGIGAECPRSQSIIEYLDEHAGPVAHQKNVLKTIAPAANIIHARSLGLISTLAAKNQDPQRLKRTVTYAFGRFTDMYIILSSIEPVVGAPGTAELSIECMFARKLIEISRQILVEAGWNSDPKWQPVELSKARRDEYISRIERLRKSNPLPDFARKENMKKGAGYAGLVVIIIWIVIFLLDSGLLVPILKAIFD